MSSPLSVFTAAQQITTDLPALNNAYLPSYSLCVLGIPACLNRAPAEALTRLQLGVPGAPSRCLPCDPLHSQCMAVCFLRLATESLSLLSAKTSLTLTVSQEWQTAHHLRCILLARIKSWVPPMLTERRWAPVRRHHGAFLEFYRSPPCNYNSDRK